MTNSRPLFYWDACVFITALKEENVIPGGLDAVREMMNIVDSRKAGLITSVITFAEILQSKIEKQKYDEFAKQFQKRNVNAYDVDVEIATLAGQLRSTYPGKLKTPDAIHVATAIHYRAFKFFTFDGCGSNPGLLALGPQIMGDYGLAIAQPQPDQYSFNFSTDDMDS